MKKIFTLVFLAATSCVFGQSIHFFDAATDITNDTVTVPTYPGNSASNDYDIHNVSSSSVNFKVKRTIMTPPLDSSCSLYFCTGALCYSPSSNVTYTGSGTTTLAGSTNLTGANGLLAHLDALGADCCDTYIKYQAYVVGSVGDTATFVIHYACVAGVNEIEKTGGIVSAAFPNPSSSVVSMHYSIREYSNKGKIIMYDMLGKPVKEVVLNEKEGTAHVSVDNLSSGIYFYTFFVDDKAIATKKLIISSK